MTYVPIPDCTEIRSDVVARLLEPSVREDLWHSRQLESAQLESELSLERDKAILGYRPVPPDKGGCTRPSSQRVSPGMEIRSAGVLFSKGLAWN